MEDVLRSGPFTSVNGDRAYLDTFFTDYFKSFIGDGVFPNPSNSLQVLSTGGMGLTVKAGKAWVGGRIHFGDEDKELTLDVADALLDRFDKVVLRADMINRNITKIVKKGTPATLPKEPFLQRDSDAWELGLASIRVKAKASAITQADIFDLRLNKDQCGIVTGVVDQVDTTTLYNQYRDWLTQSQWTYGQEWNDWFNSTKGQLQSDWDVWFAAIVDTLDGDTAGNLLNLINNMPKVLSGTTEPAGLKSGDIWLKELD